MTKFRAIILITVVLAALVFGIIFASPVATPEFAKVEINGAPVLAEVASTPRQRALGLSGREGIPEFYGMLFVFEEPARHGIWMKGMRFPIDIVWIRNGRVVDFKENAPAPDVSAKELEVYKPDAPADMVLEVKAGFLAEFGVVIGNEVKIFRDAGVTRGSKSDFFLAYYPEKAEDPAGFKYFVETLRSTPLEGENFEVGEVLERKAAYVKYKFTYESDGSVLSGVMNIPSGPMANSAGFPVLILNHGLIHPDIYYGGRGSKREQDFFARNGYVTLHPDYRGYGDDADRACPPTLSMTAQGCEHDFYVGYTRDVLSLVDALKKAGPPFADLERIGMWGHSMGGGIAARAMVLAEDVRAYVLFAPISADAEDNFYELPESELERLIRTFGAGEEAAKVYKKISPLAYFSDVSAPVQLHHGTADSDVPIEFSERVFEELKRRGKPAEFFKYAGEGHEFGYAWQMAADRALQFFDKYVKSQ